MRKKKGFTLVELLVVIAIIALLMGILMPALARVRQIAFRMVCGTNLSGIGKAMLIYSNDYEDEFPRAGGRSSVWNSPVQWLADNRYDAYGLSGDGIATISSCFYLLVKYAEVTPKSFVCKGDSGTNEFKTSIYSPAADGRELIDLWDFGGDPRAHCSYSYHLPFGLYALTTSSEPGMAVAGDRNPWISSPAGDAKSFPSDGERQFVPGGTREEVNYGNAISHQEDGQNVLFMDIHVKFEKSPNCGINDDNIFTLGVRGDLLGTPPTPYNVGSIPGHRLDSLLVHDGEGGTGPVTPPKGRGCFPADTLVWADGKLVQISKVIAGQKVGKLDSAGSASSLIEGINKHGEGLNDCYEMVLESGNSIIIVHSHYFLTVSGKWMAIEELTSGMKLQSLKGPITITSVVKRTMPFTGKSYNLIVKGAEQYLVGKDGVVALDCSKKTWELLKLARQ
jgi:prepilin-type N-terminal cleavage/methylation domain-containing protein